jgi:cytochrome c oxidase subunit 4
MVTGQHHVVPVKVYALIFLALMVGTVVTVFAATKDLGPLNIVVALSIATVKAALVVLYFMHLKYSHRLNWIFGAASILWLALLIGVTMADVMARLVE